MKALTSSIFIIFSLTLLASSHTLSKPDEIQHTPSNDKKNYLIQFSDNSFISKTENQIKEEREEIIQATGGKIRHHLYNINTIAVLLTSEQVQKLKAHSTVKRIEIDPIRELQTVSPTNKKYKKNAHSKKSIWKNTKKSRWIKQKPSWGVNAVQAGAPLTKWVPNGITVCVIDTGYDIDHPDLQLNNVYGDTYGPIEGNWYEPIDSHGPHVTGIMFALDNNLGTVGVTQNAAFNLYVAGFVNKSLEIRSSDIMKAHEGCAEAGANIVNMSLGFLESSEIEADFYAQQYKKGILTIAASGNFQSSQYAYPASYPSVVAVAAVDSHLEPAYFSQYTDQIELSGPGMAIRSTVNAGEGWDASLYVGRTSFLDNEVVPLKRVMFNEFNLFDNISFPGAAYGKLFHCPSSLDCSGAAGKICLIEREFEENFLDYPEINAVMSCQDAGGRGAIIYSSKTRPGLQDTNLLDTTFSQNIIAVSVDRETGKKLKTLIGQKTYLRVNHGSNHEYLSGTSMATPYVTGVAAIAWSYHPHCTAQEIRAALSATALDLHTPGRDDSTGFGLAQANAAVDFLNKNGCPLLN
ncbi:S8 family serine peptidase [Marinibactrum halimedae]|uniref:Peptidase S8 n=1 Tax=Marinibactrum halimedae TaxID=1444977 RepID=A0AA37T2Q7_9GAMM|nr:S8 family serine peptidase [Marinibactrum halimedae]MCD9458170.1 S8 family serine peptidase [Marinibactrum halimedae]GLS25104.1 hypothetical protein GCM10007877_08180 [Marinibactrum halimedae]